MSPNAYFMPRAMSTCVLQANVLVRGVVVLDVRWVVPNWIVWFIQTWELDVLLNCQDSNMLFPCMLYVKSIVSCFILEVTNYQPLVYHNYFIGLLSTIGFENVFAFKS